jgi:hypothetical protein
MRHDPMNLTLRPTVWSDGQNRPDDYQIIHEGQTIGRICRINTTLAKEMWCWTQFGPGVPSHGPKGGIVDNLDEANAAFRTAWEHRQEPPKSLSQPSTIQKRTMSITWADKLAIALLAITGIVATTLALSVFVYPTVPGTVGAAIGLFVVMAAIFVLPLWMILRTAVWAARVLPAGRLQRHP